MTALRLLVLTLVLALLGATAPVSAVTFRDCGRAIGLEDVTISAVAKRIASDRVKVHWTVNGPTGTDHHDVTERCESGAYRVGQWAVDNNKRGSMVLPLESRDEVCELHIQGSDRAGGMRYCLTARLS
jgi:hypothetical protein